MRRAVCLLFLCTAAAVAQEHQVDHRLVNVNEIYPPLAQEIRYATTYNFTGYRLYPFPGAWIHADLAAPLQRVQEDLATQGLGLKIWDGYRPLSVQARMWEIVPDERYVSDPAKSKGRHTRGVAVDVTLVDRTGRELRMPTDFDDFSEKAHRDSSRWTTEERLNYDKLNTAMVKQGFRPFPYEWWHYDFGEWQKYPPFDISFEDLAAGKKTAVPVP